MRNILFVTVSVATLAASSAMAAGTWVPANVPSGGSAFLMFGITNNDVVTGSYTDSSSVIEGVVGPFDGSNYTSFSDGGADTEPRGLNAAGVIAGYDYGSLAQWERSAKGSLKPITQGGNAVVVALAMGVNKSGVFAGDYTNASGVEVGAIGKKNKYTKVIKVKVKNTGYAGRGIDDAGDVAGWYYDSSGIQHGYAVISGKTVKIDYPNAYYTVVEGLNNKGIASGQWEDTSGVIHGFVYNISKKKYTSLDAPGASFTQVWGLNDAGVVAASASESSGTESFVYCMSSKGCPAAGIVHRTNQPPSGRALPHRN